MGMLCLFWIEVLKMEETLKSMAYGDSLTGLPNRRATVMRFDEMASAARRGGKPFALMLFDIDFFKRVNDTYGHQAGDEVLRHVASVLTAAKRQEDLLGRVGGEEFVLLLADTGMEGARTIAERMRELVANASLQHDGKRIAITISGGLSPIPRGWRQLGPPVQHGRPAPLSRQGRGPEPDCRGDLITSPPRRSDSRDRHWSRIAGSSASN